MNLILVITSNNLEITTEFLTTLRMMILDQKDKEVLSWLMSVDTFVNYNIACGKWEPTTGKWFLESRQLIEWTEATNVSLWIQGNPGVGKTILCSTIIEEVITICKPAPFNQYTYFYFDFNEKRTVVDILRSIIAQLCNHKNTLPSELHQVY